MLYQLSYTPAGWRPLMRGVEDGKRGVGGLLHVMPLLTVAWLTPTA